MKFFFTLSVLALGLVSCNSNDKTSSNSNPVSTLPVPVQTVPVKVNDTAVNTVPVNSVIQTSSPANGQTAGNNSNVKLNPAHGQPGHRCDINVGEPLNSPPATPTSQNNNQAKPQTVTPPVTQPAVVSAPVPDTLTVNPAHGQPGHDCTIAVGQPLKKKE